MVPEPHMRNTIKVMTTKFFSAWFCPYAQRAWLSLEHHKIPFQYIEALSVNTDQELGINGYTKDPRLLELNPKGLVPTLEIQPEQVDILDEPMKEYLVQIDKTWVITESIDCVVFLNKLSMTKLDGKQDLIPGASPTLIKDANFFNEKICSTFYKILMKRTTEEQTEAYSIFVTSIADFLQKVIENGFYENETPTIVDFTVIPWLLRIPIIRHYHPSLQMDDYLSDGDNHKLTQYLDRAQGLEAVQKTLWKDENDLIAVYRRYADGSAASQVGKAVLSGKNAHDV